MCFLGLTEREEMEVFNCNQQQGEGQAPACWTSMIRALGPIWRRNGPELFTQFT